MQKTSKSPYALAAALVLLIVIAAAFDIFQMGNWVMIFVIPGLAVEFLLHGYTEGTANKAGDIFTLILVSWFTWLTAIIPLIWLWSRHRKRKHRIQNHDG